MQIYFENKESLHMQFQKKKINSTTVFTLTRKLRHSGKHINAVWKQQLKDGWNPKLRKDLVFCHSFSLFVAASGTGCWHWFCRVIRRAFLTKLFRIYLPAHLTTFLAMNKKLRCNYHVWSILLLLSKQSFQLAIKILKKILCSVKVFLCLC